LAFLRYINQRPEFYSEPVIEESHLFGKIKFYGRTEWSFLCYIDQRPEFYSKPVIKRAIYW
jgi:hypothetical protein